MIDYLVQEAEKKGGNSKTLKSFLNKTLPPTARSFSLPCYVEKAKFNGKPSWIIVENWGFKKNEKLNQIRIWVIDASRGNILFAYSLNPP